MNCPSCSSPLEPTARFCGVCGYRLQAARPPGASTPATASPQARPASNPVIPQRTATPPAGQPLKQQQAPQKTIARAAPRGRNRDDIYLEAVLNNRFKVESKIGEGGFGAVYRGVQLATGRKVALKLLHPEMTKDENLVARFRREGMVLCNLRDAHTITTYDFDQTPDGTLYIAMELLEGKSLHQVFHEQAPLEWKRMFKILIEMCSSLAEAHQQGIVHRDLKPENVYLESRPGNPEFVKILDFGIAKVMRGDSIDPQSPQLTATGQTLGTLEYMSPEQLMGKQLDGRSDVYALGVVAYEMITGRLPFPDAKGPAGLITAQLKQTPQPPSQAHPKANLPPQADRTILKCLEKDKNNRYADVTQFSHALQEVLDAARDQSNPLATPLPMAAQSSSSRASPPPAGMDLLETRRGEMPNMAPPPMPSAGASVPAMQRGVTPGVGTPMTPMMNPHVPATPYPQAPANHDHQLQYPQAQPHMYPAGAQTEVNPTQGSKKWIWWIVALLALGAGAGAVLALVMQ
ncbi:MAG TPA: serine/threonine-protein kinase [Kofleriaceae bacterium]|nr:serine/threonine-protein kinase [Kofleriaceae bacterium]